MISDKEMRKRIADMSPQELLKASETFEALFDLVHQHDDNSIENTNPDYYKDELYLDEDFRMLAKTYPADVSAIGVTTLIDYVEAVEAELASRINELHYANTVCMEQKHKIARRDEIIARLKEDAERLADGMIISPENEGDFCSYCGGMEHVDDCPITLHRALMKELAEC
jgi:hypothetical protein